METDTQPINCNDINEYRAHYCYEYEISTPCKQTYLKIFLPVRLQKNDFNVFFINFVFHVKKCLSVKKALKVVKIRFSRHVAAKLNSLFEFSANSNITHTTGHIFWAYVSIPHTTKDTQATVAKLKIPKNTNLQT
ncbi:hypothetical protein T4E_1741 [Trichinella pseudospiralis]|uniref:Uncharacterized protein n=1 Tax=Trichinella pseudospiralis TaxID=6337 RepID=A0A0V0XDN9_TRIPS|nr:hypothetical protein T4E_1741 [Trichinella pseudospiralis]